MDGGEIGDEDVGPFEALLNDMESAISDVILGGSTNDLMLVTLLDLTIASIHDERPVFQSLMDEPILFRHFRHFTKKALDGLEKLNKLTEGE